MVEPASTFVWVDVSLGTDTGNKNEVIQQYRTIGEG